MYRQKLLVKLGKLIPGINDRLVMAYSVEAYFSKGIYYPDFGRKSVDQLLAKMPDFSLGPVVARNILRRKAEMLVDQIAKFKELDLEILTKLIEEQPYNFENVFNHLDHFKDLNQTIAIQLLKAFHWDLVEKNFKKFNLRFDTELGLALIEISWTGGVKYVLEKEKDFDLKNNPELLAALYQKNGFRPEIGKSDKNEKLYGIIRDCLRCGGFETADYLIEKFGVDIKESNFLHFALRVAFSDCVGDNNCGLERADQIIKRFELDERFASKIINDVIISKTQRNEIGRVKGIINHYKIDKKKIAQMAKDQVEHQGNLNTSLRLLEAGDMSHREVFDRNFIKKYFFTKAYAHSKEKVEELMEMFGLDPLELFKEASKDRSSGYALGRMSDVLVKMRVNFPEIEKQYQKYLAEKRSVVDDESATANDRAQAVDALVQLVAAGDQSINKELIEVVLHYAKASKKDLFNTSTGMEQVGEAAFIALSRLDNADSNHAVFRLALNANLPHLLRRKALQHASAKYISAGFLGDNGASMIGDWLNNFESLPANFDDFSFIERINSIPSAVWRKKSLDVAVKSMRGFIYKKESVDDVWREEYGHIPQNVFLQIHQFVGGDKVLLKKFDGLYPAISDSESICNNLLGAIVMGLELSDKAQAVFKERLAGMDFSTKADALLLSHVLRWLKFVESMKKLAPSLDLDNMDILLPPVSNLEALDNALNKLTVNKLQEILPHPDLTADKFNKILENWDENIEPITTYLGRFPILREYVAEILVHTDTPERWQDWRYDRKQPIVAEQIGHLSAKQAEVWKTNQFDEISGVVLSEGAVNKSDHIRGLLTEAVATHHHIYNPEMGQTEHERVQTVLEKVFGDITLNPDIFPERIKTESEMVIADMKQIDVLLQFNQLSKLNQTLGKFFTGGGNLQFNTKTENALNFIVGFLPKDLGKQLAKNYKEGKEQKHSMATQEILTEEMRAALTVVEQRIKEEADGLVKESDIFERFSLAKDKLANPGPLYQLRNELKVILDLLRLSNLNAGLIASNRIVEKRREKESGEKITTVLENLQKYFKNSPLLQDLQNIEFSIRESQPTTGERRLAMIFTDDSQILWQCGKFPIGNGSCQNYESGSHAERLMGYVGDANCKVAYMLDLNKLPLELKATIEEQGFEAIKGQLTSKQILDISIARVIVKVAKDNAGKPVLLLEPTYTVVNKDDKTMDRLFESFIRNTTAKPMEVKMASGGGMETIMVGNSRSPQGQYEDTALSSVRFIE